MLAGWVRIDTGKIRFLKPFPIKLRTLVSGMGNAKARELLSKGRNISLGGSDFLKPCGAEVRHIDS
jgi:hypothetical protein